MDFFEPQALSATFKETAAPAAVAWRIVDGDMLELQYPATHGKGVAKTTFPQSVVLQAKTTDALLEKLNERGIDVSDAEFRKALNAYTRKIGNKAHPYIPENPAL